MKKKNHSTKTNALIIACFIISVMFFCVVSPAESIEDEFYQRIKKQWSLLPVNFSFILQSNTFDEYFDSLPQEALIDVSKKPVVKITLNENVLFAILNISSDYDKIVSGQFKLIEEMTLFVFLSEEQMRKKLNNAEFSVESKSSVSVVLPESMQKYTIQFTDNKISSISISTDGKENYFIAVYYGAFGNYTVPKKIIITDFQADSAIITLFLNNYTIL